MQHVSHRGPPLPLPLLGAAPSLRRLRRQDGAAVRCGKHRLGPHDGLLGERGDRQPSPARAGAQPFGDLVQPGAGAAQPGQVGVRRLAVDEHRPCHDREEHDGARVLHGGDRVLIGGQVNGGHLVCRRFPGAVDSDGVGRGKLPGADLLGLVEEPSCLGAPRLLAGLAVVRQQVVVSRDAVACGGERVCAQPTLVEAVRQVTC